MKDSIHPGVSYLNPRSAVRVCRANHFPEGTAHIVSFTPEPMEFAEALKRHLRLQVQIPDRTKPLETLVRYAAEVFLVETAQGPAVIWLDPFWCDRSSAESCHIAYVSPRLTIGRGPGSTRSRTTVPTVSRRRPSNLPGFWSTEDMKSEGIILRARPPRYRRARVVRGRCSQRPCLA
jgi:hypothetical protein